MYDKSIPIDVDGRMLHVPSFSNLGTMRTNGGYLGFTKACFALNGTHGEGEMILTPEVIRKCYDYMVELLPCSTPHERFLALQEVNIHPYLRRACQAAAWSTSNDSFFQFQLHAKNYSMIDIWPLTMSNRYPTLTLASCAISGSLNRSTLPRLTDKSLIWRQVPFRLPRALYLCWI